MLDFGEVLRTAGVEEYFAIGGGFIEVQPDHVTILADSAEQADEIDVERAENARRRAEEVMRTGVRMTPTASPPSAPPLLKAQVRVDVGRRRRHRTPAASNDYRHDRDESLAPVPGPGRRAIGHAVMNNFRPHDPQIRQVTQIGGRCVICKICGSCLFVTVS